ncbi:uncharacterized protein LOC134618882 isoform X3 [Pelmatolapia mariae]|uniref:uncharacterized protein LOC134618882 isoform X3 n=1 Tax=Pelmatolapia mariae TaxID=158779 RepID=UPI002FE5A92E
MKVHHTLICFFFLSLQDGNPEVTNAQFLHYGVIGGGVTAKCVHYDRQTWKMFCREECEGENILINTTDARAQTGRYSIEYYFDLETGSHGLYVSISKLTESDSGQYSCGLGGSSSSASFTPFGIFVAEAAGPSATTTGSSTPSLTLTGSTEQPEGAASTGLLLYVIISLLIIIILSSLTVLIICIKRKSNRGLRTRGNSEGTNMEDVHYENCTPGSTREDSTYQSLDPAGRDQDQTYFTLTRHT